MRETPGRIPFGMRPPCDETEFMYALRPEGWVQFGESWGLWWQGRQVASVQTDARGILATLSCRKLRQNKQVRAASVRQAKRYAERWSAVRILQGVPPREAVARLVVKDGLSVRPRRARIEIQQERRLAGAPPPPIIP
jgi:hypothetical protein